jgi:hypothetical protein
VGGRRADVSCPTGCLSAGGGVAKEATVTEGWVGRGGGGGEHGSVEHRLKHSSTDLYRVTESWGEGHERRSGMTTALNIMMLNPNTPPLVCWCRLLAMEQVQVLGEQRFKIQGKSSRVRHLSAPGG